MAFDPKHVGRAIRQLRTAAGLTQADLAERAGLAFETVSRVESGREPPSLRTAVSLADAMNVSLDAVVGRVPLPSVPAAPRPSPDLRRLADAAERLEPAMLRHVLAVVRAVAAPRRPEKRR